MAEAPQPDSDVEKPRNVIEAVRLVMRALPAIGKDGRADPKQGAYAYRGIEQITAVTQGLFAKYGVVLVPRVLAHEVIDITVNEKPWTDTRLTVEYDAYGPGGIEDKIVVGPLVGIGRDNSDKGANKAMTQVFKYALLQLLCISDSKDDGDGGTHEADAGSRPTRQQTPRGPETTPTSQGNARRGPRVLEGWADIEEQRAAHDSLTTSVKAAAPEVQAGMTAWKADGHEYGWPMSRAAFDETVAELERLILELPF